MNLWANRIGQLALSLVALFFFSCEDEASVLGFKNQNQKFDVSYIEIPIESSVLLLDSQRTSNFVFQTETNRLLVGQYADDKFGPVSANGYTQFFTNSGAKLPANVTYDSVTLQLVLDFYNYGSADALTSQTFSVYELDEDLKYEDRRNYFNKSEALTKPTPLGTKTFSVSPKDLDTYAKENSDTTIVVKIPLDNAFGQRIFDNALLYRDVATTNDSTFKVFTEFIKLFKGLSIKSDNGDKVLGFSTNSAVTVHYHTPSDDSLNFNLGFFNVTNFSQIKNDRSSTELSGLTQYAQDFSPASDLRYIQSGTGVYTKLDFGKFFEFADAIPNVVITSAQLSVGNVVQDNFIPPSNLVLRILRDDNTLKKVKSRQDSVDISAYNPRFPAHPGTLTLDNGSYVDSDLAMNVLGDQDAHLKYSSDKKSYDGNYALFFQQLSIVREGVPRYRYFVLNPSSPSMPNSKSVNRAVFPKGDIKLKVYYTKPTTPLN
ncbi:MAG TPA: DUF4270 family protein [Chryseolinea sp.]|nr:DUF4270 family protein [Chryseolinea sp.]